MYMALVARGITAEKVEVPFALDVPHVDPLTTINGHRKWAIILADLCFVKLDIVLVGRGE